jgi:hypothetical protein
MTQTIPETGAPVMLAHNGRLGHVLGPVEPLTNFGDPVMRVKMLDDTSIVEINASQLVPWTSYTSAIEPVALEEPEEAETGAKSAKKAKKATTEAAPAPDLSDSLE